MDAAGEIERLFARIDLGLGIHLDGSLPSPAALAFYTRVTLILSHDFLALVSLIPSSAFQSLIKHGKLLHSVPLLQY